VSTIRCKTGVLVGMLTDLLCTAPSKPDDTDAVLFTVVMFTERGHLGAEPGRVDLLVGASTDSYVAGHAHMPCIGQWHGGPMLWSVPDTVAALAVLKALGGRAEEHEVELTRDHRGVTIAEDPDLFDEATALTIRVSSPDDYPLVGLFATLAYDPPAQVVRDGAVIQALPRTDWATARLAPFLKIAGRRRQLLSVYRWHQDTPVLVQVGDRYRGAARPMSYEPSAADGHRPSAEIYPPPLPPAKPTTEQAG
jgi:hypothetical protein